MTREDLQFEVSKLQKDKIIYAVEACAITLVSLLVFFFSNQYFPSGLRDLVNTFVLVIAVIYTVYMGVGNFSRLSKIKRLERELAKAKK